MPSYAEERDANIARNRAILLGLDAEKLRPETEPKETRRRKPGARVKSKSKSQSQSNNKRKADTDAYSNTSDSDADSDTDVKPRTRKTARVVSDENAAPGVGAEAGSRRRSSRIAGKGMDALARVEKARGTPQPVSVKRVVGDAERARKRERRYNPKTYGAIPGVGVGSWWVSREECSNDSVHAPWVGGIAPGPDGAYSIALSGGYDDDVDDGYAFTYTGAGGRDLKGTKAAPKNLRTAEQSFDQSFEHNHNKSLLRSVESGKPVRVIRGYKLRTKYGPSEGYRYDGLYVVKKAWQEKGLNKGGFLVCKFAFVRLPDQPAIPVKGDFDEEEEEENPAMSDGETDVDAEGETVVDIAMKGELDEEERPAISGGETDAEGETVSEEGC